MKPTDAEVAAAKAVVKKANRYVSPFNIDDDNPMASLKDQFWNEENRVILEGGFTIPELEAIVLLMRDALWVE